jgi:hypothetical protein
MIGPRSTWIAARARNAARRGVRIVALGSVAAALTALALVLVPRAADRQLRARISALPSAPDSVVARRAVDSARALLVSAMRDATIDTTIDTTLAPVPPKVDAVSAAASSAATTAAAPPAATAAAAPTTAATDVARDPSTADLVARIRRARQVPLVASYRNLADAELLLNDTSARALRDSIDAIERAREAQVALGGADARYAALTTRISELGHALVRVAEQRVAPTSGALDTTVTARVAALLEDAANRAQRDSLSRRIVVAESALQVVRVQHATRDTARATLERQLRPSLPVPAIALAALIVGIVMGYGGMLVFEMRRPTIGDAAEVERLTGTSVLVHSRDTPSMLADRSRWTERPGVPKIIDRSSDTYVLLHLALSGVGDVVGDVDVVAADATIGAAVALGTAAAAAGESRAVLLVEGAARKPSLAELLRTPVGPSSDARPNRTASTTDVHAITLDRDARIDVLFAGTGEPHGSSLVTRYDLRIYLATGPRAATTTPHDVIVCARPGHTTLAWLSQAMADTKSRQQRVRAVVLWNRERPRV